MLIHIDRIFVPKTHRAVDPDGVKTLMKSIQEIGLQTPISVRKVRGKEGAHWQLVAGRHRLTACKKLGHDRIECTAFEGDELDAEMWEIAENLHRTDLTAQERGDAVGQWAEHLKAKGKLGALNQCTKKGGKHGGANISAVGVISKATGDHRNIVREQIKIAKITPEARKAADAAELNTHRDRAAIASVPPAKQVAKVAELVELKKKNEQMRREYNPITAAWDMASDAERGEFLKCKRAQFGKYGNGA